MRFRTRLASAFSVVALSITLAAQTPPPVPKDDLASLRQRADAGDAQAQYALGDRYYRGIGVAQNYTQALFLYRKSAGQGFAPAQNQLGGM